MRWKRKAKPLATGHHEETADLEALDHKIHSNVEKNHQILQRIFAKCSDVVFRELWTTTHEKFLAVYIDVLIDQEHLDTVLAEWMNLGGSDEETGEKQGDRWFYAESIPTSKAEILRSIQEIVSAVLKGQVAILADSVDGAIAVTVKGSGLRVIEEPQSERVVRGPREGFIESLDANIGLVRRRIRSERLKTETLVIGDLTQTKVVITYIEGLAPESVLTRVRERLGRIQIDGVLESGYIEEFIQDAPYSPFPTVQNTERPDVVAANLLEGKVAMFIDNTPFVLIVPFTFWNGLQANEDYYIRSLIGSSIRTLRHVLALLAMILPSLYVALVSYQQEMVPTPFLLTIAAAEEATPFPAVVEAFLLEITFEALREAGLRLPTAVGSAVNIVGALVIGEAAVSAGVVSAPMVIIVAFTGIASFTIPRLNTGFAIRILRFPILFLAGIFGFYGITLGLIAILLHLTSIRSFGVPYFSPIGPFRLRQQKDLFVRAPWPLQRKQ